MRPTITESTESSSHVKVCGRKAAESLGCAYTAGNAAVPHVPVFTR